MGTTTRTRRTALSVAAAGTAVGVAGLVLLANPPGAVADPPKLPAIGAESLVQSVLTSKIPAMSGTVALKADLGLPVPGLPSGDVRIFTDGAGRAKVLLPSGHQQTAVVEDGTDLWIWNSGDQSVTKVGHGALGRDAGARGKIADPQRTATDLVSAMRQSSTVTVDGTGWVADRPVYELVLTPKPTERTLLREVRVAVDSDLRVPLRLEVFANGQSDPSVNIGFTEFSPGQQDPALFRFTPPPGAVVTERNTGEAPTPAQARDFLDQLNVKTVGSGWDTVLTGTLPKQQGDGNGNPMAMIAGLGKPVQGAFGTGHVISTSVATVLVTDDGRVALGAVPEPVLAEALGK